MRTRIAVAFSLAAAAAVGQSPTLEMPVLDGDSWFITEQPDLGQLTRPAQQTVDHALFRSRDGVWHVWACVRQTGVGRLFHHWESPSLLLPSWKPNGVSLRADFWAGESLWDWNDEEWLQAPFVIREGDTWHMFYGGHQTERRQFQICQASSTDGRTFTRRKDARGFSRIFVGPGETRDPMVIQVGERYLCYYTGWDENRPLPAKIYVRVASSLEGPWGKPQAVSFGGSGGSDYWSAECPFVLKRGDFFYLFRTSNYVTPITHVYRSTDPFDFGLDDDSKKIGTIAVAAPEIVTDLDGTQYISSVHELHRGIVLTRLAWVDERRTPTAVATVENMRELFDFEEGYLTGFTRTGAAFANQPTYSEGSHVRGQYFGLVGSPGTELEFAL